MLIDEKLVQDLNYFLDSTMDAWSLADFMRRNGSYNFIQVVQHFAPDWTESEIKRLLKLVA